MVKINSLREEEIRGIGDAFADFEYEEAEYGMGYAWVRNPMYSGWWMILSGITLMWHNAWMLILPVIG